MAWDWGQNRSLHFVSCVFSVWSNKRCRRLTEMHIRTLKIKKRTSTTAFTKVCIFVISQITTADQFVFFVLPWVNFVLPWVNFVLPWVNFVLPWVNFVLPWVKFIVPWFFVLPWQLWATAGCGPSYCSIFSFAAIFLFAVIILICTRDPSGPPWATVGNRHRTIVRSARAVSSSHTIKNLVDHVD